VRLDWQLVNVDEKGLSIMVRARIDDFLRKVAGWEGAVRQPWEFRT